MKVYLQVLYLIIYIIYTIDRWLILYIYNSHHTKITKAKAFDFKIGKQRNVRDLFSKRLELISKHMKNYSSSLETKKMLIKIKVI